MHNDSKAVKSFNALIRYNVVLFFLNILFFMTK